jgi:hypothetical protein
MAYTKPQLEAIKNSVLASAQPIFANMHRTAHQSLIDALFDAETLGNILAALAQQVSVQTGDEILIVRNGSTYRLPYLANPLERVSLDVSGSTVTINMADLPERVHVGNGNIGSDKEFVFSNASNLVRETTFITVSGSTRNITLPANVLTDVSRWTWSKPSTQFIWAADPGTYRLQWTSDGTNIHLDISGHYSSTI